MLHHAAVIAAPEHSYWTILWTIPFQLDRHPNTRFICSRDSAETLVFVWITVHGHIPIIMYSARNRPEMDQSTFEAAE